MGQGLRMMRVKGEEMRPYGAGAREQDRNMRVTRTKVSHQDHSRQFDSFTGQIHSLDTKLKGYM